MEGKSLDGHQDTPWKTPGFSYTEEVAGSSPVPPTFKGLFHAGNPIISIALSKSKGITADGIIRSGKVREKNLALCQELDADYLVLGKPGINEKRDAFTNKKLKRFLKRVDKESPCYGGINRMGK